MTRQSVKTVGDDDEEGKMMERGGEIWDVARVGGGGGGRTTLWLDDG